MVFKSKKKGTDWERHLVERLNKKLKGGDFKRVAGSGALGTTLNEPLLMSDVKGNIIGISKPFRVECKVGYGGAKQFALKKEWLDKIQQEADASYSIPILAGRFSGARSGVEEFIVMDLDIFCNLMNLLTEREYECTNKSLEKD